MLPIILYSSNAVLRDAAKEVADLLGMSFLVCPVKSDDFTGSAVSILDLDFYQSEDFCKGTRNFNRDNSIIISSCGDMSDYNDALTLIKPIKVEHLIYLCKEIINDSVCLSFANIQMLYQKNNSLKIMQSKICVDEISLTSKEFAILYYLSVNPGKFDKASLLTEVFGYKDPKNTHTLEVHLSRLSSKLADHLDLRKYIGNLQ